MNMSEELYKAPDAELIDRTVSDAEIWNPDAAGAWSILFTPIFGSILVYKNWNSLGESELAAKSKKCIYISVFMAIISVFFNLIGFIYLVTWYYLSQKKQTKYIKEVRSGIYNKKGWLKPLGIALLSFLGILFVGLASFVLFGTNA